MLSLRFIPRLILLAAFPAISLVPAAAQQPSRPPAPLTVEEVVQLSKAGFPEDVIITRIRKSGKAFDLSTDELVELKKLGLTNNVIKFLMDPSQPYAGPDPPPPAPSASAGRAPAAAAAPAAPAGPPRKYPADPNADKVPPEPGLYYFPAASPVKIDLKLLLGSEEKSKLLKKGKAVAYIIGPASKIRMKQSAPLLYLRIPEGKGIEEFVLMALDRKSDRRELEMGPSSKKQEFKAEAMKQFDSLEIGPQLFKLTPAKLPKGEYLLFQIGSAEPPKGSYGKGFDFGVDDPPPAAR